MALAGRGFGATAGFGEESTWGTEVSRTNWLALASQSLARAVEYTPSSRLGALGQASSNFRYNFLARDTVAGAFSWPMAYDDSTILLMKHLLGANATSGAGPYVHTITLASPVPTGLTIEMIPGTFSFDAAQQFTGCKFTSGSISWAVGQEVMAEVQVIGRTSAGLEAAGTPTYSSNGELILQHQKSAGFTLGGTSVAIKAMTINVDRGLQPNPELGSQYISEPVEDRLNVTIDLTMAWQQADWHTKFYAGTQGAFTGTFTSGSKSLAITAHNCIIETLTEPVSGPGMVEQRARLRAYAGASDQGLALVFTNGNSSHSAN